MPCNYAVYKVFLSSPSDLFDERKKFKKRIEKVESNEKKFKCIMWENDLPSMRTNDVQAEINERLLRESDIIVGMFREKFGVRTVEEIELAITLGKPVILYFFDPIGEIGKKDEEKIQNLSKIYEFKRNNNSKLIYHEYKNIDEAIKEIDRDLFENLKKVNLHPYSQFIYVLQEKLREIQGDITKYETVLLTIPDSKFIWNDEYNDLSKHFLEDKRDEIERCQYDVLRIIVGNDEKHFVKRAYSSLVEPYTYRYFHYFCKMFKKIINCNPNDLYNNMLNVISSLCEDSIIRNIIDVQEICSFVLGESHYHIDEKIEYISVCFNKLVSAIIYMDIKGVVPDRFTLKPLMCDIDDEFKRKYTDLKERIMCEQSSKNKIELYTQLYNLLHDQNKEIINYVSGELACDFFLLVNNVNIQDNILYPSIIQNRRVLNLYNMFYENIKYRLYRNYKDSDEYSGFMRYDLIDRFIALRYNESRKIDDASEYRFDRIKPDHKTGDFVIRQANVNDVDNIKRLNNPTPPYRRAIYVKSDDNEIDIAVKNKEVWLIEECLTNEVSGIEERNIACVAVILDCENQHSDFNTDSLTKEFEKKYSKIVNRNFKYIDFDSVIVNDGRSALGNSSYRGCGFQRLMLIFTEVLAREKNCDYICATVSAFNWTSNRNFMLNGYHLIDYKMYGFKGNGESPYYSYIMSNDATQKEKDDYNSKLQKECIKYRSIFERLSIDCENYKKDKDVPRNFLLLNLVDNDYDKYKSEYVR